MEQIAQKSVQELSLVKQIDIDRSSMFSLKTDCEFIKIEQNIWTRIFGSFRFYINVSKFDKFTGCIVVSNNNIIIIGYLLLEPFCIFSSIFIWLAVDFSMGSDQNQSYLVYSVFF